MALDETPDLFLTVKSKKSPAHEATGLSTNGKKKN